VEEGQTLVTCVSLDVLNIYALDSRPKRSKLNAKVTKHLFARYYEGLKAYRLMCLATKKVIKNRDVTFIKEKSDICKTLEMCPSGSNGRLA